MAQTVEELTARLEKAKQVFKEMKSQMDAKDNEIASLKEQVNNKSADNSQDLQNSIYELEEKLTKVRNSKKELEESYQNVTADLSKYKKENLEFAQQITDLTQNIKNAEKQFDEMNEQLRNNIVELQQTVDSKDNEIEELNLEINKLKNIAANYKKQNDDIQNINKTTVDNYNSLASKYNQLIEKSKEYDNLVEENNNNQIEVINELSKVVEAQRGKITNKNLPGLHDFLMSM